MMKDEQSAAPRDILLSHRNLPDSCDNEILLHHAHPVEWTDPVPDGDYDLVVLGGGPAGITSATFAAGKGKKVALVEEALLGGECFNIGCIPSKSIIRTSRLYSDMKNAENFGGIVPKNVDVDFPAVMARMQRIRAQLSEHVSAEQLRDKGIDIFFGHAEFFSTRSVTVDGRVLRFKKGIIATGSRPLIPNIPGLEDVDFLTNETVFNLKTLPASLLVIGGGSIGCELAQAFCRLGAQVTIVQTDPMFLNNIERDGAQILSEALSQDGISVHLNSTVLKIEKDGDKKIVDMLCAGIKSSVIVETILVGVGQTPNTQSLNLKAAAIDSDSGGAIQVDRFLATSNPHVFAVGTVCNALDWNHIPVAAARTVAQNAFSSRRRIDTSAIPWCIYTDPEIAHIGIQVVEARAMDIPVKTFTIMMHEVDRAVADSEDEGFVKIHVREGSDVILGATIVSRHAGDIINGISLAMQTGIGLSKFAEIHYPYPTQSDAIRKAAVACRTSLQTSLLSHLGALMARWSKYQQVGHGRRGRMDMLKRRSARSGF